MFDTFVPVSFKGHEPAYIRKLLMKGLSDTRIPNTAWKTQKMKNLNPDRDKSQKGSIGEYVKLATSIERYYSENNGLNYYRLLQVDFNGDKSYSNIIVIEFEIDRSSIQVYPNYMRLPS